MGWVARRRATAQPPRTVAPALLELVQSMTVAQVLAAVDVGELDVDRAIEAEQTGRARVTLLSALRDR